LDGRLGLVCCCSARHFDCGQCVSVVVLFTASLLLLKEFGAVVPLAVALVLLVAVVVCSCCAVVL
jgi:hypothetical protein